MPGIWRILRMLFLRRSNQMKVDSTVLQALVGRGARLGPMQVHKISSVAFN
jgi:hypothetical protein